MDSGSHLHLQLAGQSWGGGRDHRKLWTSFLAHSKPELKWLGEWETQKSGLSVCLGRRGEPDGGDHLRLYHGSCQLKIATAREPLKRIPESLFGHFGFWLWSHCSFAVRPWASPLLCLGFRFPTCKWGYWVSTRRHGSALLALLLYESVTHLSCWIGLKPPVLPRMNPKLPHHIFLSKELRKFSCRTSTVDQTLYWSFTQIISFHPDHPKRWISEAPFYRLGNQGQRG